MPLINVMVSLSNVNNEHELIKDLSLELSKTTGKPEKYVMCILQTNIPMCFAGTKEPCCYVEVKSIGALRPSEMSKLFCDLIESRLGIESNRIYINFDDIEPNKWGFNGRTFG